MYRLQTMRASLLILVAMEFIGWFWLGVARGDEKTFPHMWNKLNRKMQNY